MSYSELLFRMGEYEASWNEYEWRFVGEKSEVPLNISPIAIRGNEYNYDNFKKKDNVYSYKDEVEKEMISYCKNLIYKKVKKDIQIFTCTP